MLAFPRSLMLRLQMLSSTSACDVRQRMRKAVGHHVHVGRWRLRLWMCSTSHKNRVILNQHYSWAVVVFPLLLSTTTYSSAFRSIISCVLTYQRFQKCVATHPERRALQQHCPVLAPWNNLVASFAKLPREAEVIVQAFHVRICMDALRGSMSVIRRTCC
jgi:hypothetical protein